MAQGPVKWDVDGNRYVDYFGGHGALILGHHHPVVMEAVHAALDRGTHFGACHEAEVRWAELVRQMVPSAERVRFTTSGTEATLMALRLARAYTGRQKFVHFRGHFHGWHDHVTSGHPTISMAAAAGVLGGIADNVLMARSERRRGPDQAVLRAQGYRRGDPGADGRQLRQHAALAVVPGAAARPDQTGRHHPDLR